MGIMILTALGLFNLGDIYRLSYLKNIGMVLVNLSASVFYAWKGKVDWPMAICVGAGGCIGAFVISGLARRLGPKILRKVVSAIGLTIAATMLVKQFV